MQIKKNLPDCDSFAWLAPAWLLECSTVKTGLAPVHFLAFIAGTAAAAGAAGADGLLFPTFFSILIVFKPAGAAGTAGVAGAAVAGGVLLFTFFLGGAGASCSSSVGSSAGSAAAGRFKGASLANADFLMDMAAMTALVASATLCFFAGGGAGGGSGGGAPAWACPLLLLEVPPT